jgi:type I restriction enzyme S subunit
MSDELPKGWATARISDVTERVPNIKPEDSPNKEFGYVDISSIDNASFVIKDVKRIKGKDAPSRARRPIRANDVIFSNVRTYLRNIAVVGADCGAEVCSTGFTVLRSNAAVEPRFLFRYVLTDQFLDRVTPQQTGTHYPATSDKVVMSEAIPLAPLAEQRRIVAKLEKLLGQVDACQQRLEKMPTLLKRFRQSILAAACSGRLTADWRKGDDGQDELPRSWELVEFGSLIAKGPNNGLYKPQSCYGSGTPIVRIDAFYDGKISNWSELKRLQLSKQEREQFALADGDILINRVNSPKFLGKCAIVRAMPEPSVYESNMMRLQLDAVRANSDYAILYLRSSQGLVELRKNAKHAVNQSSINQDDVKSVLFALPPLAEQQEIVRRVAGLFALADQLEQRLALARKQVDKLTPSLLARAFAGQLVPQNPTDEPAEKLLARVRQTVKL